MLSIHPYLLLNHPLFQTESMLRDPGLPIHQRNNRHNTGYKHVFHNHWSQQLELELMVWSYRSSLFQR